jgi:hypothetical protein
MDMHVMTKTNMVRIFVQVVVNTVCALYARCQR